MTEKQLQAFERSAKRLGVSLDFILKNIKGERTKGLGDVVEKATHAVGIKPCGSCKKRKEEWNKKFPIVDTENNIGINNKDNLTGENA